MHAFCFVVLVTHLAVVPILADEDVTPVPVVQIDRTDPVVFERDVRPILAKKCFVCHSGNVSEGGLDMSSFALLVKGGESGAAFVKGKSADSRLVRSAGRIAEPFMPPLDDDESEPLTPQELALIRLWIDQGARPPVTAESSIKLQPLSSSVRVVRAVAIAPDKSYIAVGQARGIHVYDGSSGDYVRVLDDPALKGESPQAHAGIIESLAVSADGELLASGAFTDVAVWNARTGELVHRLSGFQHRVTSLDFSPDTTLIAAGSGAPTVSGQVRIFEARSGRIVHELPEAHSDSVFGVRFSPDGRLLATCGADMTIRLFDVVDGHLVQELEGHTHHVLDVAWQSDGKLIASAGSDRKVRLWDPATGEQLTRLNRGGGKINTVWLEHSKPVNRLSFVGDTTYILTSSGNQPVQLWDLTKEMRPGNYAKPYFRGRVLRSFGDGEDFAYGIDASPDGGIVVAGGRSGVVRLFNGKHGKLIRELAPPEERLGGDASASQASGGRKPADTNQDPEGPRTDAPGPPLFFGDPAAHQGAISGMAHSAQGNLLASAGVDGVVRLWDSQNRKSVKQLIGHDGYVRDVAFSPDGTVLASCGADERVMLWDVPSGKHRVTLWGRVGDVRSVTFMPDGTLCSGGRDGVIRLWNISQEQNPLVIPAHDSAVKAVAISDDGQLLATAADDQAVHIWNANTFERTATLRGHTAEVTSVVFTTDASRLVTASVDQTVRVWDVASGSELRSIEGHAGTVLSAAVSPDGKTIASGGNDKLVRLWNAETGEEQASLEGHTAEVYCVRFSSDGSTLASTSHDLSVRLWEVASGKAGKVLKGHQGYVSSVAFSEDGNSLVTASADRTAKVWDTKTGKAGKTFSGHTGVVFDAAFSADGQTVVSASGDESVRLWAVESGELQATLRGHSGDVNQVHFIEDGTRIVSAGEDGTLRVWSREAGRPPRQLTGHQQTIYSLAVSPDGDRLASCGYDGTVRLWNPKIDRPLIRTLTGHTHVVVSVMFSPDGQSLASASHDGTVRLWNAESGELKNELQHTRALNALSFAPDGQTLVAAGFDRAVHAWDMTAGKQIGVRRELGATVNSLTFSSDGRYLFVAG